MTTIYLICAAESEDAIFRIAGGQRDYSLTSYGLIQAKTLRAFFARHQVSAVCSSPQKSALDTAGAIWDQTGITPVCSESLREISTGIWEGAMWGNLAYEEPRKVEAFRSYDPFWRIPEAESFPEAVSRLQEALLSFAAAHPEDVIAAVTHRHIAGALLNHLLPDGHQKLPVPSPCTVAVLQADGGNLQTVSVTDGQDLLSSIDPASVRQRTVPDFDTDACCYLLREIEYGDTFVEAIQSVWEESGENRHFDRNTLINDASRKTTYIGFVEQTPACFLQTGPLPGWITLLVVHPGCRNLGVGAQMIGLAAMNARNSGSDSLSILLPPDNPHRSFFEHHGFMSEGFTDDGRELMTKHLS